MRNAV